MALQQLKVLKKSFQILITLLVLYAGYTVYVNLRWAHTNGEISKLRHDIRTLSDGVKLYHETHNTLPDTIAELKANVELQENRSLPETGDISFSKTSESTIEIKYAGPPLYGASQSRISDFVSQKIEVNDLGKIDISFPDYERSHSRK